MPLIFGHDRLDVGQFPDLMANRFGVRTRQRLAASTAGVGHKPNDIVTLLWRNQFSVMLLMSLLPATFSLLAISPGTFRFGMRMLCARWQRRVLRRKFLNLVFQASDPLSY